MHAREPDLADLLILDESLRFGIERHWRRGTFVPQFGMEGGALLVERERLTGAGYAGAIERMIRQFERQYPFADAARHLVERQTVGGDGVPHPEETDAPEPAVISLVVVLP